MNLSLVLLLLVAGTCLLQKLQTMERSETSCELINNETLCCNVEVWIDKKRSETDKECNPSCYHKQGCHRVPEYTFLIEEEECEAFKYSCDETEENAISVKKQEEDYDDWFFDTTTHIKCTISVTEEPLQITMKSKYKKNPRLEYCEVSSDFFVNPNQKKRESTGGLNAKKKESTGGLIWIWTCVSCLAVSAIVLFLYGCWRKTAHSL